MVSLLQQGQIAVRFFNCSDTPRRVYKGSTVGELCPLVEENNANSNFCYFIPQTEKISECIMAAESDKSAPSIREIFPIDNSSLTESEKSSIYEVLSRHPKVISGGKTDLGKAKGIEHSIDTGNAKPTKVPTRRLPFHKRETIRKEVESMMDSDVIEHSCSPWSAPVVLVKKKDGTERFCVDYRKLNEITRKDVYPFPRCEEILESLSGTIQCILATLIWYKDTGKSR